MPDSLYTASLPTVAQTTAADSLAPSAEHVAVPQQATPQPAVVHLSEAAPSANFQQVAVQPAVTDSAALDSVATAESVVSPFEALKTLDVRDLFLVDPYAKAPAIAHFEKPEDVQLPFFALEEVELPYSDGFTGSPQPYSFRSDDYVTALLLVCFLLTAWVLSHSWPFLRGRIASLFRDKSAAEYGSERTNSEMRGVVYLVFQAAFAFSLLFYDTLHHDPTTAPLPDSPYLLLALATGGFLLLVALKTLLYSLVNHVFFDRSQCVQWTDSYIFSVVGLGLLILPVALLVVYFDLDYSMQRYLFFCMLGIVKIALFLRCFRTFFATRGGLVHFILYLCALEIVPALTLWRVLFWASINLPSIL